MPSIITIFNVLLRTTFREGSGTPLQYSCLENPMDRGAWWAAVHGVSESRTRLSDFTFHFHALEKEMATHSSVLCLENPRDGRAWWAAVYGVAQRRTRLKRFTRDSSSSIVVCTCQSQILHLSLPRSFSLLTISFFRKSVSLFVFCK